MIRTCLLVVLVASSSFAAADWPAFFHNGDLDEGEYIVAQSGGAVPSARLFENFTVTAPGWHVSAIWGSLSTNFVPAQALVEIRTGISPGNGGSLVYSANAPVSVTTLGGSTSTGPNVRVKAQMNVILLPGAYWFCISPIGTAPSHSAILGTTSGANATGSPTMDGNAFYSNPSAGFNFVPASTLANNPNFSMGMGHPFPEPASLAALGLGALALTRRRKR